tara:strand:- start:3088 stop:3981 length:894 start_codon:yes stop_codon:yes gene_type:complete
MKNRFTLKDKINAYSKRKRLCPGKFDALDNDLKTKFNDENICSFNPKEILIQKYSKHKKTPYPKISNEKHIPGYNFCGPGTQVEDRLKRGDLGINDLDNACRVHDVEYQLHVDNIDALKDSDKKLKYISNEIYREINKYLKKLKSKSKVIGFLDTILHGIPVKETINKITNPSLIYEQIAAKLVSGVFTAKGFAENIGLIDPVKFAKSLNSENLPQDQLIEEGIKLYKKYIMDKKSLKMDTLNVMEKNIQIPPTWLPQGAKTVAKKETKPPHLTASGGQLPRSDNKNSQNNIKLLIS